MGKTHDRSCTRGEVMIIVVKEDDSFKMQFFEPFRKHLKKKVVLKNIEAKANIEECYNVDGDKIQRVVKDPTTYVIEFQLTDEEITPEDVFEDLL